MTQNILGMTLMHIYLQTVLQNLHLTCQFHLNRTTRRVCIFTILSNIYDHKSSSCPKKGCDPQLYQSVYNTVWWHRLSRGSMKGESVETAVCIRSLPVAWEQAVDICDWQPTGASTDFCACMLISATAHLSVYCKGSNAVSSNNNNSCQQTNDMHHCVLHPPANTSTLHYSTTVNEWTAR